LTALRNEPEADMGQVVIVANGASALAALALAARHIDGVKGIVNTSGGLILNGCDLRAINEAMGDRLTDYGKMGTVPSLWLYADNDQAFDMATVNHWRDAYANGGNSAELAFVSMEGKPGYLLNFLPTSVVKKMPYVDRFLGHLGLPTIKESDVDKLIAKLGNAAFRALAREYLSGPGDKALAVSHSGKWVGAEYADLDDSIAVNFALRDCNQRSGGEACHILMLNNDYQR
jgi:hypothetical protein